MRSRIRVGSESAACRPAAKRLKRVLGIDIEACARCGAKLAVIASIEKQEVIAKIRAHLERTTPDPDQSELPLEGQSAARAVQSAVKSKGGV